MQQSWFVHIFIYFDSPERTDIDVNGLDAGDKDAMDKARE